MLTSGEYPLEIGRIYLLSSSLSLIARDNLQRLAGNCELRSVVLCSHGNKDGKSIDPLLPPSSAPSTVRMSSEMGKETLVGVMGN